MSSAKRKKQDDDKEPATKRKKTDVGAVTAGAEETASDVHVLVLDNIRRQETVLVDSRMNFPCALPKKARIATTAEQWRAMHANQAGNKLSNNYAQIVRSTVKIQGPLKVADIQPLRLDNHNYRYLQAEEAEARQKMLPRNTFLGSSGSIAQHPYFGHAAPNFRQEVLGDSGNAESIESVTPAATTTAKRSSAAQEWIYWVVDACKHHYPMMIATFRECLQRGYVSSTAPTAGSAASQLQIDAPSGWTLMSDDDRIFIVPRDFCPATETKPTAPAAEASGAAPASATPAPGPTLTPAIQLSKACETLGVTAE